MPSKPLSATGDEVMNANAELTGLILNAGGLPQPASIDAIDAMEAAMIDLVLADKPYVAACLAEAKRAAAELADAAKALAADYACVIANECSDDVTVGTRYEEYARLRAALARFGG